ncbi:redoxin domain-containing protein [uncultured Sphingomonas sp.]|uniref:redoxin domain-containing protein n=1 Tax=unclassified Sphingomonas TaxID=196159 RepID=UPI0025E28A95|nr:redoxin domain-containing protein [uncultured Sphingomonas sp.]
MRILSFIPIAAISLAGLAIVPAAAQQVTGKPAGNFRLTDADGKSVTLDQFKGRPVVLEWNNPGCPFVQKHYDSGNMQATQAKAKAAGAVWLTINSGAPGKQGYMTGPEAKKFVTAQKAQPTAYLLDPQGRVGKGYAAKTTPHMYLIDASGKLVYQGGIDDKPTADKADIAGARNHVLAALGEVKAGKPVSVPETRPYGCSVKYAG